MSTPRSPLGDETVMSWHHRISRCVRSVRPGGDGCNHRKAWIMARLREQIEVFAIPCGGFAEGNA